jgi:hypothetical protein
VKAVAFEELEVLLLGGLYLPETELLVSVTIVVGGKFG